MELYNKHTISCLFQKWSKDLYSHLEKMSFRHMRTVYIQICHLIRSYTVYCHVYGALDWIAADKKPLACKIATYHIMVISIQNFKHQTIEYCLKYSALFWRRPLFFSYYALLFPQSLDLKYMCTLITVIHRYVLYISNFSIQEQFLPCIRHINIPSQVRLEVAADLELYDTPNLLELGQRVFKEFLELLVNLTVLIL